MPWNKPNNPFYNDDWANQNQSNKEPERFIPITVVEVVCLGCERDRHKYRKITFRIGKDEKDANGNGHQQKQCRHCRWMIDVYVYSSGDINVQQADRLGGNRQKTGHEKVYQE